jgi:hypothetical protein
MAALLVAVLVPGVVAAQTDRLQGRIDARTHMAMAALLDSARQAGLPLEPLVNKALEGASKGADGPRIMVAVRALATRLREARAVLGSTSSEQELVAGAAALRAGVGRAFLERLRGEHPNRIIVLELATMADLVARGVPADTAARAVIALARAGVRDAELVAFRQSVERDIALGAPAGASASVRVSSAARDGIAATAPAGANPPPSGPRRP